MDVCDTVPVEVSHGSGGPVLFFFTYVSHGSNLDNPRKGKGNGSTHLGYTVLGTGTQKITDEVNRRDVCECDG